MAPLLEELNQLLQSFQKVADAKDWHQYHTPKNLTSAIAVEAAELMEVLQWHKSEQSLSATEKQQLADEMADVFLYLLCLADKIDVDLVAAAQTKMQQKLAQITQGR